MKQQPLSKTNAHLHDPEKRRQSLLRSVLSSSAVEGIQLTAEEVAQLERKLNTLSPRSGSAE